MVGGVIIVKVVIHLDLVMIPGKLHESLNIAEFVLVDNMMLTNIDMIHRLSQIYKGPAA